MKKRRLMKIMISMVQILSILFILIGIINIILSYIMDKIAKDMNTICEIDIMLLLVKTKKMIFDKIEKGE